MSGSNSPLKVIDRRGEDREHVLPGNTNDAKERMTLDQIRDYDDENHKLILEKCELYRFEKQEPAGVFHWEAWRRCMRKLGCQALEQFWKDFDFKDRHKAQWAFVKAMNVLRREMHEKRISVEGPSQHKIEQMKRGQAAFKIGKYVYYKGDIVYFISDVLMMKRRKGLLYLPGEVDYCVFTNAPKE